MGLTGFIDAITDRLVALTGRAYYGETIDPNVKIPYTYWKYASTVDIEDLEDFIIEVDVIDHGPDCTSIEGIVAAIDGDGSKTSPSGMNYWQYGTGSRPTFRCYRINRLSLPSGDEFLVRRQLRYRVRTYL